LKNYHNIIVISTISDNWDKINNSWAFLDKENWNNLDNLWAGRFLSEGKDFPDIKDKVCIFLFCNDRITLKPTMWSDLGKLLLTNPGNHPRTLSRCPIFVVDKSLLILEEEVRS
jgi:hypothetical protein